MSEETTTPFEAIRREDETGHEYWSARDLARVLDYSQWRNFKTAIDKARIACENSGQIVADHFAETSKMVGLGSGSRRKVEDINLSRYACYLVIQNADPSKEIVALGQTYFAAQTRRQEAADELAGLTEAQRRLFLRGELAGHNKQLADTAKGAGVVTSFDFAVFQDHGYSGLYGGEKAKDIHQRKGLKPNEKILDHMGAEELAANLFRATQTEAKIRREKIKGKEAANQAHNEMGQRVREFIEEVGGTMPEELATPVESIQELEKQQKKKTNLGPQSSMFGEEE
ncbi:MAG: damage-inducible protein [Chloroflexi bacterium]|nr:damage-inducible protein [Chloroflexota bacterium]